MYAVSDAFLTAVAANTRSYYWAGTIMTTAGKVYEFGYGDILKGSGYISSQCCGSTEIELGTVYSSELGITLLSEVDRYTAVSSTNMRTETAEYYSVDPDDGLTMNLGVNPLLQFGLDETRAQLCTNILNDLQAVNYVPFDSDTIGNPALDLGNVLTFSGGQADEDQITCITSIKYTIGGRQTLKCVGKNPKLSQAKSKNDKNISGLLSQIEEGKLCPGIIGWNADSGDESQWKAFQAALASGTADIAASGTVLYRVRKTWADSKSQKGAYKILANAKKCADKYEGYSVFDADGNVVYVGVLTAADASGNAETESFQVKVSISNLNIRVGPGTEFAKTGKYTGKGVFTIVETSEGTGSAAGWGC